MKKYDSISLYLASIDYKKTIDTCRVFNTKTGYEKLIKKIRKDIKNDFIPENHGRLLLGELEMKCGNYEKAKTYFVKALNSSSVESVCTNAMINLGEVALYEGDYNLARQYAEHALLSYNYYRRVDIYSLLAKIAFYENKMEEVLKYYRLGYKDTKEEFFLIDMLFVYVHMERYDDAICLLNNVLKYCDYSKKKFDIDMLVLFLSKKFNIFFKDYDLSLYRNTYGYLQMKNYDYECAVDHIKKHNEYNVSRDPFSGYGDYFDNCIDMHVLVDKVKDMIDPKYKMQSCIASINDAYIIPYPNIGVCGSNLLCVVTLPNSKDILTLYPVGGNNISQAGEIVESKRCLKKGL